MSPKKSASAPATTHSEDTTIAVKEVSRGLSDYLEQTMHCLHGKVVEETLNLFTDASTPAQKQEVGRILAEWDTLARDVVGMGRQLAKMQTERVVKETGKTSSRT